MMILGLLAIVLLVSSPVAGAGDRVQACAGPPVLKFSLSTDQTPSAVLLGRHLQLGVEGDKNGWELAVYKKEDSLKQENLLYPIRNWHGAQALQITPALDSVFPRDRVIKVRTTTTQICVRIRDARVDSGAGTGYIGGTVEVRWSTGDSRKQGTTLPPASRP